MAFKHLKDVNETYFEHLCVALGFSIRFFIAALACLIHAFLPCLFTNTASRIMANILSKIESTKRKDCFEQLKKHNEERHNE